MYAYRSVLQNLIQDGLCIELTPFYLQLGQNSLVNSVEWLNPTERMSFSVKFSGVLSTFYISYWFHPYQIQQNFSISVVANITLFGVNLHFRQTQVGWGAYTRMYLFVYVCVCACSIHAHATRVNVGQWIDMEKFNIEKIYWHILLFP